MDTRQGRGRVSRARARGSFDKWAFSHRVLRLGITRACSSARGCSSIHFELTELEKASKHDVGELSRRSGKEMFDALNEDVEPFRSERSCVWIAGTHKYNSSACSTNAAAPTFL